MIEWNMSMTLTRLDRLMCGEREVSSIEWRGTNMLIIDYVDNLREVASASGETVTEDISAGSSNGGRRISVTSLATTEPLPNTTESQATSQPNQDAAPLTREMVLESLRRRTDERLQRKQSEQCARLMEGAVR
ncbi:MULTISPECIES: hypothetical protein [unclassified Bifidobacterium]|uniref:hypothetical protein n=1 Tax=unclassified Bifidobacterium TaxID=2608897 RepID=UPI00112CFE32|nr:MULTISPECIES: hypothetical protein [unclassified Bifidobacterium]TPF78262.1 hypothetical protein BW09_05425 [Bifidobacterium sp. UTCIF-1]TPF79720.1 hypothetical protein BW08_08625 [Bifidobacterium sp. UTCIF-24]TPF82502.1 hypothetical protein BW12_04490 [Bifidobacterium sp. UTCIF-3]TPF84128.1 hypothetical protein BW07_06375 [Bifidobacterium sp. UTCIF-36]TPF89372.1 hypothetical protein BW10_06640 [Bifidobacterium sp. UTBIF-56]